MKDENSSWDHLKAGNKKNKNHHQNGSDHN